MAGDKKTSVPEDQVAKENEALVFAMPKYEVGPDLRFLGACIIAASGVRAFRSPESLAKFAVQRVDGVIKQLRDFG